MTTSCRHVSELVCHAATPVPAVSRLLVTVRREQAGLALDYRVEGDIAALRIPASQPPAFADELWRHTCLEAFIAQPDGAWYRELNFSPSGRWAAYDFVGYRERDPRWMPSGQLAPDIATDAGARFFSLRVCVPAALLPTGDWLVGLCAVIETRDGALGYWALRHSGERPDFHTREAFCLRVPDTTVHS